MLPGADSVGVLDGAAEVKHGKHGEDHDHALQQQSGLKLLPYPEITGFPFNSKDSKEVFPGLKRF